MPKILKPGIVEKITRCTDCGCEFSYTKDEIEKKVEPDPDDMRGYVVQYISCPQDGCDSHVSPTPTKT